MLNMIQLLSGKSVLPSYILPEARLNAHPAMQVLLQTASLRLGVPELRQADALTDVVPHHAKAGF